MRKRLSIFLILFFSFCLFSQDDVRFDHIAPITQGWTKNIIIQDTLLFVDLTNMVNIYSVFDDSLILLNTLPASCRIGSIDVNHHILTISPERYDGFYTFIYDISNVFEPELILKARLEEETRYNIYTFSNDEKIFFLKLGDNDQILTINEDNEIDYTPYDMALGMPRMFNNNDLMANYFYSTSKLVLMDFSDFNSPESIGVFRAEQSFVMTDSLIIKTFNDTISILDISSTDSIVETSRFFSRTEIRHIFEDCFYTTISNKIFKYQLSSSGVVFIDSLLIDKEFSFSDSMLYAGRTHINLNTMETVFELSDSLSDELVNSHETNVLSSKNFILIDYDEPSCVVYDIRNHETPHTTAGLPERSEYYPVYNSGSKLITKLPGNDSTFYIYDFSDLNDIYFDEYNLGFSCNNIEFHDDYAYFLRDTEGLSILELNNLEDIELIYENSEININHIRFSEDYLIINSEGNTHILDIATFEEIYTYDFDSYIIGEVIFNNYLYLGMGEEGLRIFDISDIESPVEHYFSITGEANELYIVEENLFIRQSEDRVDNYDLRIPYIPIQINSYSGNEGVELISNYIIEESSRHYDPPDETETSFRYHYLGNPDSPHLILYIGSFDMGLSEVHSIGKGNISLTSAAPFMPEFEHTYHNWASMVFYSNPYSDISIAIGEINTNVDRTIISDTLLFTNGSGYGIDVYNISSFANAIEEPRAEIGTPDEFSLGTYPNPFNSTVSIETMGAEKIEIFDINGKKVAQFNTNENTNINWTPDREINSGVYLIRANHGKLESSKKIVYIK